MIKKKISFLVILFISLFLIMLGIYLVNNKPKENIKINVPNINKSLFSVNVPEGIKTEIAYIQNNNYLAIVFENKTNENISSGKLKVVIGNKEIEKRLELLPIGKKAIFKIAVPNELKDTINKSKVTITLTEIKSSNNFSFIDVDKINNTKTNVSVIENDTNINISGINKTGEDLDALIEGLKDGTVTCISTDHAPHSDEEKLKPIDQAPFGIIGNQHAFSLVYTYLVKKNLLDLETVLKCMTVNPSQVIGLDHDMAVGKKANIAIIDLNEEYTITRDNIYSKAKNTPFLDTKCFGLVKYHILDGKIEKL